MWGTQTFTFTFDILVYISDIYTCIFYDTLFVLLSTVEDKVGVLKAMIGKIVGELDNIRMLFGKLILVLKYMYI